jgi:hypothetical protein
VSWWSLLLLGEYIRNLTQVISRDWIVVSTGEALALDTIKLQSCR